MSHWGVFNMFLTVQFSIQEPIMLSPHSGADRATEKKRHLIATLDDGASCYGIRRFIVGVFQAVRKTRLQFNNYSAGK